MADEQIIGKQEKGVHFGCNLQQFFIFGERFRKRFQASALSRLSPHQNQKVYFSIISLLQKKKTSRVFEEMPS